MVLWLLILLAIEIGVRLRDRGVTEGVILSVTNSLKIVMYLVLMGFGIYWASLSHWLYFWDELLWIAGFAAIEMNMTRSSDGSHAEQRNQQLDPS